MTSPTVSVALCTFNGESFIAAQVRSILDQTLPPAELVVSDDGSTDATLQAVRDEFAQHPVSTVALRILPNTERLGVTGNFERALAASTGDLIALADQDDVWHENRLSDVVEMFSAEPSLMFIHSNARLVNAEGEPLDSSLFASLSISQRERELLGGGDAFLAHIRRNLATGATSMLRRSLLDLALPIPREWVHDEWLAIIAAARGQARVLDRELIDYRQHGANQIGVQEPTLSYRIGRMLEPRADRYRILSARSTRLAERLPKLDVSPAFLKVATDKARFEQVRARYSRARIARIGPILSEWASGSYSRLSSQGNLDVVRDLLQAGERSAS